MTGDGAELGERLLQCPVCSGDGELPGVDPEEVKGRSLSDNKKAVQSTLISLILENGEPAYVTSKDVAHLASKDERASVLSAQSVGRMFSGFVGFPRVSVEESGHFDGSARVWEVYLTDGTVLESGSGDESDMVMVTNVAETFHYNEMCPSLSESNTVELEEKKARFLGAKKCEICVGENNG